MKQVKDQMTADMEQLTEAVEQAARAYARSYLAA
jgi:hypothetical protein